MHLSRDSIKKDILTWSFVGFMPRDENYRQISEDGLYKDMVKAMMIESNWQSIMETGYQMDKMDMFNMVISQLSLLKNIYSVIK